jgi:hypothetical protein
VRSKSQRELKLFELWTNQNEGEIKKEFYDNVDSEK